ncbi:ferredoxin [Desulforamulus reducens MI-1]|uniref:Ferredoxin n=1 Tax=Desulforamulus reducens (strain ATCC BAA-1160 / DSM 100696 / MI-1) TaxID=349161 RepID=A4J6L8_DESRM|nr:ASKHA domain-containing protein [Desulforamulus reducens]ABO50721.1 ferredoxin [Desulforamulus reducens MI-1]
MDKIKVIFQPVGVTVEVPVGITILEAARLGGICLTAPCGGNGRCGKCRVKVYRPGDMEKWVLACHTPIFQNITVEVPPMGEMVILEEGNTKGILPDPVFLLDGNGNLNHRTGFVLDSPEQEGVPLGLAVDVGTTTMVGYLYDLFEGKSLSVVSHQNGQFPYGSDVISRLAYAIQSEENYRQIRRALLQSIEALFLDCCRQAKVKVKQIREIVTVGNTPMMHMLLQLPLQGLATAPFQPYAKGPFYKTAFELGLGAVDKAICYFPPFIGGFVGSDALAAALAQNFGQNNETQMLVDIGTNGEIILQSGEQLLAASAPAGPALEGGNIHHGMIASSGAIDKVNIDFDVQAAVIGGSNPQGICGSGLVDALAEMLRLGILHSTGRMREPSELSPVISFRIKQRIKKEPESCFFLAERVAITQQDIREVQLAKAAIAAGIEVVLKEAGIAPEKIDSVQLAGGFGNYLNAANAKRIGLLGRLPLSKVRQVGNAAGAGAISILLSYKARKEAEYLQRSFKHLELASDVRYQRLFLEHINFPDKEY